jgi:hypothetical protein
MNRTGDRTPGLRKGETSTGLCGMGNQNPRTQSEAAPDESVVMRAYRPANIRLIIVAIAEFGSLFCSLANARERQNYEQSRK